jgi:hypothetical protein
MNGREDERVWAIGGRAKGKEPLGRPRRRWVDKIKMGLPVIEYGVLSELVWLRTGPSGKLL